MFAEWLSLGKELPTRLVLCSHCILSICNLFISRFGFVVGVLVFDCSNSCQSYLLLQLTSGSTPTVISKYLRASHVNNLSNFNAIPKPDVDNKPNTF